MQSNDFNTGDRSIPRHVAIIMDGNGRWAQKRGMPRVMGHRRGAQAVRRTVEAAVALGIKVITLFAFSSENWKRPALEVSALMQLFARALDKEVPLLKDNGVKLRVIGNLNAFPLKLQQRIQRAQELTSGGERLILNVAANYGGRWDIVQAAKKLSKMVLEGSLTPDLIDEKLFASVLAEPLDVDLLIRTGGEKRISNFLMWQSSYSELYFSDTLWPDFDRKDLEEALSFFSGRERRFGMISSQLKDNDKC